MVEQKDQPIPEEIDLKEILNVLKKWRKIIVLTTIITMLIGGIISFFVLEPVYEAKTRLLVKIAVDNKVTTGGDKDNLESVLSAMSRIPLMTINTYKEQLKIDPIMQRVVKKLNLDEYGVTSGGLAGMISTEVVKDSNIIEVKVQNTKPNVAVVVANTLNSEFLEFISEKNQEQLSRSMTFFNQQKLENDKQLQEALDRLKEFNMQPGGVLPEYKRQQLQKELERLEEVRTLIVQQATQTQISKSIDLGSTSVEVFSPATAAYKVKPNKQLNMALALVLGLVFGIGLAFLLDTLDNTIGNAEDVERQLGLPVIGLIPDIMQGNNKQSRLFLWKRIFRKA